MLEFTTSRHECVSCHRKGPGFVSYHNDTPVLFHCSSCVNWLYNASVIKEAVEESKSSGFNRYLGTTNFRGCRG